MTIIDREDYKLMLDVIPTSSDIHAIYFTREMYNDKGDLIFDSKYEFFIPKEDIKKLIKELKKYE
ncbi:MAG: hypothetical protein EBU90_20875 [Proteobacteria bacterium]|nr:hypothetical protein [Pseudomonadota bacterium]NBP13409.1 hypothetical protein [bacterium]